MAAEFELQKALFAAVSGLGYLTYDAAPQAEDGGAASAFPYVEIGAIVPAMFDTKEVNGFDAVARIHTYSRSAGMRQCKDIQGAIYARLHNGALIVAGQNTILIQRETSFCSRIDDNAFHGVCEYRVLIEAV